jgi:hypothetical protein
MEGGSAEKQQWNCQLVAEMTNQTQRIVFISYSHVDTDFVNIFSSLLLNLDIQIWKDSKDLQIGGEILDSLSQAVKNASHFCCIISSSSVKSPWVRQELNYAKQRQLESSDLAIVPILIDEVEIPDYVGSYRCARLQNRSLSLDNPELIMTLRAFGVDLADAPPIITGPKRRRLLRSCAVLQERMIHFRQKLATFQERYKAYGTASLVPKTIMIRETNSRRRGIGFRKSSGRRSVYNPAYSKIKVARDQARSAVLDLRESSSWVPAPLKEVKQALQDAGLSKSADEETLSGLSLPGVEGTFSSSDTYLWRSLESALDDALTISEAICKVPRDEDTEKDEDDDGSDWGREDRWDQLKGLWWTGEKLPRWIRSIAKIEATLQEVIGTLEYWGRFDSDK